MLCAPLKLKRGSVFITATNIVLNLVALMWFAVGRKGKMKCSCGCDQTSTERSFLRTEYKNGKPYAHVYLAKDVCQKCRNIHSTYEYKDYV